MNPMPHSPLISTQELANLLGQPKLKLVDGSWWLNGRDAHADYLNERLPDAVFFDLEAISDHSSPYPHMLPSPEHFAQAVGDIGIGQDDTIIIYDTQGLFSAARVWWTFKIMGAKDVRVLDGGLPKWKAEGRLTQTTPPSLATPVTFIPSFRPDQVVDTEQVKQALSKGEQVLDARGSPRFKGEAPEPRTGVRSGHMPGAMNLPFGQIFNADGTMKRGDELKLAYETAGVDMNRPVITTCGSGVTAAVLSLGLAELGLGSLLYDGSWSEWGARSDTPVAVG